MTPMTDTAETGALPEPIGLRAVQAAARRWPGLVLCAAVALLAVALVRQLGLPVVSPMVAAVALGMVIGNIRRPSALFRPGITLAMKVLLKVGIVLIAFQITLAEIIAMGGAAILVTTGTMFLTFGTILCMGAVLRVSRPLTELIAAGTSVCGASAIMAASPTARAGDEEVAYALAVVTLFGTVSTLIYPFAAAWIGMAPGTFGLWAGATIHEVGQVTAAAFQLGSEAGEAGTVSKLLRVSLLVAVILVLAMRRRAESAGRKEADAPRVPFPAYVILFGVLVVVNSFVTVPPVGLEAARWGSMVLMTVALAAMGLMSDFRALARRGARPLLLGLFGWVFVSLTGLGLVLWLAG